MNRMVAFSIFIAIFHLVSGNDPPLAPYKLSELSDPFEIYDQSQREAIRSIFTRAYYDSKCDHSDQTIIEPIYYWPGDSVKLRCVNCVEEHIKNGIAKNWAVFQKNIPESIEDLQKTLSADKWGNEKWLILDEFGAEQMKNNLTMKSFIPNSDMGSDEFERDNRSQRNPMSFFQRDGYLIINNTDISNYGLYRCFDKESRYLIQYIYYLIPITPIYQAIGFEKYSRECDNEAKRDIWRLDGFNQYRFFPRLLINSNGTNCKKAKGKCDNYAFDEAKLETNPIAKVRPKTVDSKIVVPKFNLEIFLHWSKWTSCGNGQTEKTRTGFCHIRKTDPSHIYEPSDNMYKIYSWLLPIHKLLENVDEFSQNGILLFSGVLGGLLLRDTELPQHCTIYPRQAYEEMQNSILDPLIEKAVNATTKEGLEISASLCFRFVKYPNHKTLIFGHPLFQNELC